MSYVDLEADRVEVYCLREARYGRPDLFGRGDEVASEQLAGFAVNVEELLGSPEK